MLGMDTADMTILNFPFVHPDNEAVNFELFIRRSLASGVIPNVGGNSRLSTSTTIVSISCDHDLSPWLSFLWPSVQSNMI